MVDPAAKGRLVAASRVRRAVALVVLLITTLVVAPPVAGEQVPDTGASTDPVGADLPPVMFGGPSGGSEPVDLPRIATGPSALPSLEEGQTQDGPAAQEPPSAEGEHSTASLAAPALSIPDELWDTSPPAGPGQTYVVLQGAAGDPISRGAEHLYTQATARITVHTYEEGTVEVRVRGQEQWSGYFRSPAPLGSLAPGVYPAATYANEEAGRVHWSGEARGCSRGSGWLAVDEVTMVGDQLRALTIRFAQSCNGAPPLHGKVVWRADDPTRSEGPRPVPPGLWDVTPPTPPGQSYLHIAGHRADGITDGRSFLYTKATAELRVEERGGVLHVEVRGDEAWSGEFVAMDWLEQAEVGYYPGISDRGQHNPVVGGQRWAAHRAGGPGQTCGDSTGWVAIDEVTRIDGVLQAITMRFSQTCTGYAPLHGELHWRRDDPTTPPGPVVPPPGHLWGVVPDVPAGQDFLYLRPLGRDGFTYGETVLVTSDEAPFELHDMGDRVAVVVQDRRAWTLDVAAMSTMAHLEEGFYPALKTSPWTNPARGGIKFGGNGLGCPGWGWFVVDEITRTDEGISSLFVRFQYQCLNQDPVLGALRLGDGAPPATRPPFGLLDSVQAEPGAVRVQGWAIDPDTDVPADVHVYVGGRGHVVHADRGRADVVAAHPGFGPLHGFDGSLPAEPGLHQVCAHAIDRAGGPSTFLGCRTVTVGGGSPHGFVDSVSVSPGSVRVQGWAIDPDTRGPIDVHVYVGGRGVATTADARRDDVVLMNPGHQPFHGYDVTVPAGPGTHEVCAYGINIGVGGNSLLSCHQVVVPGGSPFGHLDVVSTDDGGVRVQGWAIDPDTAQPIDVHVYVDGVGAGVARADGRRDDVGAAFPGYGSGHGYDVRVPAAAGARQVCVYGINVGVGGNALIACRPLG